MTCPLPRLEPQSAQGWPEPESRRSQERFPNVRKVSELHPRRPPPPECRRNDERRALARQPASRSISPLD
jgi:hypothetical protein